MCARARWFDLLRDYFTRILGAVMLCGALVTLLVAPPKPDFSITPSGLTIQVTQRARWS